MKKILFAAFAAATIGLAGYNVIESIQTAELSDLTLKNIEALANDESMTSEEFIEKTDCEAVLDNMTWVDCNGITQTYAKPYEK